MHALAFSDIKIKITIIYAGGCKQRAKYDPFSMLSKLLRLRFWTESVSPGAARFLLVVLRYALLAQANAALTR